MSLSDPLGDMLTRIRNAQRARQSRCVAPASRLRANVLEVLKREGYIRAWRVNEVRPGISSLDIELKYSRGRAGHQGDHPRLQAGPARLFGHQGSAEVLQRPRHLHPVHAPRRDERHRSPHRQCRR